MARVELDELGDEDGTRVYLASSLREAQRVEALLGANEIEYAVAPETFVRNTLVIFPTSYVGAAFYVRSEHGPRSRALLAEGGLARGVVDDET